MSLPISITIANPDPSAAPTTFQELVELFRELITAEVTGSYLPYVTGSGTPDVADQDKVWHRTDGGGRPMGTYVYYSGAWRRQYIGNPKMILLYNGDPSVDFAGADGLGTAEGEWDGWALCNGENGTVDLSDKFVVGSHMSDMTIGYSGGAHKTSVSGSTTQDGGVAEVTLNDDNTYRPARAAVAVGRQTADGNAASVSGPLYGVGSSGSIELLPADAGQTAPDAIATLPPYYALAFAQFVGYA